MATVDLDEAVKIAARVLEALPPDEFTIGSFTWRDAEQTWPYQLTTDRSLVARPGSVGFELERGDAAGKLVLFAQGFADILFYNPRTGRERIDTVGLPDAIDLGQYGDLVRELVALFDE
ncbi:hypothetical protein NY547_15800 [Cnuibacter physcomitrellae]|uniref:hypothetical protein n=1 Tax=Cnuibacter physcomitrellae TaxID=1619308 RepID=UPI00217601CA|nr:hypothetical protein [Cnuibacter physcomitrellae]MCS5498714.1 hypothetical protein [Cnuibacter physcomitrellae]